MGFFKSTKGSIISDYFKTVNELGNYRAGDMVDVALYNDQLIIKSPFIKQEITLNYSQITDVFYGLQTEITEKNKSVIGRALVGGILLGGVGAIVGGISGTGTKKKKDRRMFFIISYKSNSGEDQFLQFEDTRMYKGSKIAKQLKELCNISDEIKTNIQL